MSITHTFVSAKADGADATQVRASNWNAAHTNNDPVNETPVGTIDGANNVFTLASTPSPATSLQLFRNGVLQLAGTDFNLSVLTITYVVGREPQVGDWHRASYRI